MVLDVQGAGLNLYDPEIALTELTDGDGSLHFCNGNLAEGAIKNFFAKHKCNFIVGSRSLSFYHQCPGKKVNTHCSRPF